MIEAMSKVQSVTFIKYCQRNNLTQLYYSDVYGGNITGCIVGYKPTQNSTVYMSYDDTQDKPYQLHKLVKDGSIIIDSAFVPYF